MALTVSDPFSRERGESPEALASAQQAHNYRIQNHISHEQNRINRLRGGMSNYEPSQPQYQGYQVAIAQAIAALAEFQRANPLVVIGSGPSSPAGGAGGGGTAGGATAMAMTNSQGVTEQDILRIFGALEGQPGHPANIAQIHLAQFRNNPEGYEAAGLNDIARLYGLPLISSAGSGGTGSGGTGGGSGSTGFNVGDQVRVSYSGNVGTVRAVMADGRYQLSYGGGGRDVVDAQNLSLSAAGGGLASKPMGKPLATGQTLIQDQSPEARDAALAELRERVARRDLKPADNPQVSESENEIIAKWIKNYFAFGPGGTDPRASLSQLLGREMSQEEFNARVAPSLTRKTALDGGGGPVGGDQEFFEAQDPGMAWTRYLAKLGGAPPTGTFGRDVLENKGKSLAPLSQAFGYGIPPETGGQGLDFAGFYNKYGSQGPSWADIRGKASDIMGSVGRVDADMLATAKALMSANKTAGVDPNIGLTMDEIMASKYTDPADELELTQAGLRSRLNPTWQAGLISHIKRRFENQQATQPNERWLQYARQRGLI